MIEIVAQWQPSNSNMEKAEKYNVCPAMIEIFSSVGAYAIIGQIIPGFFMSVLVNTEVRKRRS